MLFLSDTCPDVSIPVLNVYTGVKTSGLGVWKKQHLNLYTGVKTSGLGVW
jgi:hypothetical protein